MEVYAVSHLARDDLRQPATKKAFTFARKDVARICTSTHVTSPRAFLYDFFFFSRELFFTHDVSSYHRRCAKRLTVKTGKKENMSFANMTVLQERKDHNKIRLDYLVKFFNAFASVERNAICQGIPSNINWMQRVLETRRRNALQTHVIFFISLNYKGCVR